MFYKKILTAYKKMGKKTRKCYYKKSSSSSCHKCSSCSSSSSDNYCKKKKCCCSSSSSAFTIDECRQAAAKGNWHPRKYNCSSDSSSKENTLCKSTSATCAPCRYDISKKDCPSSSSSCCSDSSCCSSSTDCYSSSSSSSCSSSSNSSCDPYYKWNEKPIKTKVCKNNVKCTAYKWRYGYGKCKHNNYYGKCTYGCKPVCCTSQYNKKKYKYNDFDAVRKGKYDAKFGKQKPCKKSSSSEAGCPGGNLPCAERRGKKAHYKKEHQEKKR